MSSANLVGKRIKGIRESRQMTVADLARAIPGDPDANSGLIERLEQGSLVPSLTPLLQVARALGVRLGSFLDDQTGQALVHARAGESGAVPRFSGSNLGKDRAELSFRSLAANKTDRHMEPFLIDVQPHEGETVLSSHEGEEFIHVLEGGIELAYGKDLHLVPAGDSIYYDSIVPHHLHAAGKKPAKILAVIYAPA